jgi:hypothetical protein
MLRGRKDVPNANRIGLVRSFLFLCIRIETSVVQISSPLYLVYHNSAIFTPVCCCVGFHALSSRPRDIATGGRRYIR